MYVKTKMLKYLLVRIRRGADNMNKNTNTKDACDEIYKLIKDFNERGVIPCINDLFYRTKHSPYFISLVVRILEERGLVKRVKSGTRILLVVGDGSAHEKK